MRLFAGQSAWVVQRLTALLLLLLLLLAVVNVLLRPPGFAAWRELATSTHGAVLIIVGYLALALHAWIGARDVVLDYVHHAGLRLAILGIVAVLLAGVLVRTVLTLAAAAA
ncbi:MAG TPA: succinate dehydrogenase, hydrophobic membrane anchor protein [Ideonella sp.]|nr:succinate dehydrogenase, hydrophobic membrane anchor protein [Ideonella sp.]